MTVRYLWGLLVAAMVGSHVSSARARLITASRRALGGRLRSRSRDDLLARVRLWSRKRKEVD